MNKRECCGPAQHVLELVGRTPILPLRVLPSENDAEIWVKLEGFNPGGSVKDRIALSMIETAERDGCLSAGGTILEPTSGNTGIGLAMVARIKGYRMVLTMPETMSMERRQMLQAFGAELVLTPGNQGMGGAVTRADEILAENPTYLMPQQFNNAANPEIHRQTTAQEILSDLNGVPDGFVAGVGTGGTITGCGEVFREKNPSVRIVAVEPTGSPILSGGQAGPHKIAGIGAGFVPQVLNTEIYDRVDQVTDEDSKKMTIQLALKEGLLVGISSGAAMVAGMRLARELGAGRRIVVILPDRGDRYLSAGLFRND